jgi:hypothetical protein
MKRTCVICGSRYEAKPSSRYCDDACCQKGHELRQLAATLDLGTGAALPVVLTANRGGDSGRALRTGTSR